ncbi:MAG: NAD-dependent epimerase/dehydratase family protein [Candidatus Eisenbacteria bacterium]
MTHALVTGAAGFIGSHLTERLLADGVRVSGVDAFTSYYDPALKRRNIEPALRHPSFTLFDLDLGTGDLAALPDVDVVFHQAAQPGVQASWGREFAAYAQQNVIASQRLLERYKGVKLERFVYASSSSVYGDAESYPTPETLLPRPFSPYGVTKLAGEHLTLLYGRNFGLPVTALRYFTVYGPRQRPDMAFHRFCRAMLAGEPITVYGDGRQSRDFTFISDAIEANVRAWRNAAPQSVYNIGGGSQVEVVEAIAMLESSLGVKAQVKFVPRPPGDPDRTRADASRLAADLGYRTTVGIADGLAAEAEWARSLYGGVR